MSYLVRSWNVFHGRTHPPARQAYLEDAVTLAAQGDPDVLCLQELPLWSSARLERWSGMAAYAVRTRRGLGFPGRWITNLHHGFFRSSLAGQANAVLVASRLAVLEHRWLVLNGLRSRAKERRMCQAVRVALPDGRTMLVLNLHLSHHGAGRPADAELRRAASFADELAVPGEPVILVGDFNVTPVTSSVLAVLTRGGFSAPSPGIDHILVRGTSSSPLEAWPDERRRLNGLLVSDHAPVELYVD